MPESQIARQPLQRSVAEESQREGTADLKFARNQFLKSETNIDVGKRLATARRRFYGTASEAARELGISGPTYLAHENGTRGMRADMAEFYGQKYGISTDWLLYGRGAMERTSGGAASPAQFTAPPSRRDAAGPEPLLAQLDVARDNRRVYVAPNPAAAPAKLPLVAESDGYVCELVAVRENVDTLSRRVELGAVGTSGASRWLAFRDVYRLPPEMLTTDRALIAKVPRNDLVDDMPGGQRVVVDPDDTALDDRGGLFVINPNATLKLVLAYRSRISGEIYLWEGRRIKHNIDAKRFEEIVIGRVTTVIREYTSIESTNLLIEMDSVFAREISESEDKPFGNDLGEAAQPVALVDDRGVQSRHLV